MRVQGQIPGLFGAAEPVEPQSVDSRIDRRLLAALQQHAPLILVLHLLVGATMVALLWEQFPAGLLMAWWLMLTLVNGWRLYLYVRLGDTADPGDRSRSCRAQLLLISLLSGSAWGLLAAYAIPRVELIDATIVLLAIAGMVGGAIATSAASRQAFALFSLPALLPAILVLAGTGQPEQVFLALCILTYVFGAWQASGHIHQIIRANIITSIQLEESTAAAETMAAELYLLSSHDALTGAANRRSFDDALEREWFRAERTGSCLSLLMVNVDCFRTYNDECGSLAGDRCLQTIATRLTQRARRGTDVVARFGGDEFAILLPDTSTSAALSQANAIREQIAQMGLVHPSSSVSDVVTVSVGAATLSPSLDDDYSQLIRLAEAALHQAKSEGRNRVCRTDSAAVCSHAGRL